MDEGCFEGSLDPARESLSSSRCLFSHELKSGVSALLHLRVGDVEPVTLRLEDGDTDRLIIKTNREGWRAWCCGCRNRYYDLGTGHLEPLPRRIHSIKLSSSVKKISAGDEEVIENMLKRSLSLLRRYPTAESIDLTFPSLDMEERLRMWADRRLTIDSSKELRRSSRIIRAALEGRSPSEETDTATVGSDVDQSRYSLSVEDPASVRPDPLVRAALVYPATARGERRGSYAQLRSQSQRMATRRSSNFYDTPGIEEENKDKDGYKLPTLRKMESARDRRGGRGQGQWSPAAAGGASLSPGSASSRGSQLSLRRAVTAESRSSGPRSESGPKGDFWDPLGLLSDLESTSPPPPLSTKSLSMSASSGQSMPLHGDADDMARKPLLAESTELESPAPLYPQVAASLTPPKEGDEHKNGHTE